MGKKAWWPVWVSDDKTVVISRDRFTKYLRFETREERTDPTSGEFVAGPVITDVTVEIGIAQTVTVTATPTERLDLTDPDEDEEPDINHPLPSIPHKRP